MPFSDKSDAIQKMMISMGLELYGRDIRDCWKDKICIKCGKPAVQFDSEIEEREYAISAFCSACQKVEFAANYEEEL